jgi:GT2 family glycosyltransferase
MRISVVIVTRNRKEDVKRSIDAYLNQEYEDKEVIVIDNESTDGTREMMEQEYPQVKYMWLPDNFDIRAINIGVEMSTGDVIWRTDSDSHPESPKAFQMAVDIFENNPDIHIISTEDIEVRKGNEPWNWYPLPCDKENVPPEGYKANFFPGTGAAIRREVFDKIGGFWEFGFEELDFCTRAIVAGFNVRYFPNIRTLHYASPQDRDNPNRWIWTSRQFMRYNWRYMPTGLALKRMFQIFLFQMMSAIVYRYPILAVIECFFTLLAVTFYTIRNERQVVPEDKLEDITLGVSLAKTQYRFFKQVLLSKIRRTWKKK